MKGWASPIAFHSATDRALATLYRLEKQSIYQWYQSANRYVEERQQHLLKTVDFEFVRGCVHCATAALKPYLWCCDDAKPKSGASALNWHARYTTYKDKYGPPLKRQLACNMKFGEGAVCNGGLKTTRDSLVTLETDGGFWPEVAAFQHKTECPDNYQRLTIDQCTSDFIDKSVDFSRGHYSNRPTGCSGYYAEDTLKYVFWNTNPNGKAQDKYWLMCIPGWSHDCEIATDTG